MRLRKYEITFFHAKQALSTKKKNDKKYCSLTLSRRIIHSKLLIATEQHSLDERDTHTQKFTVVSLSPRVKFFFSKGFCCFIFFTKPSRRTMQFFPRRFYLRIHKTCWRKNCSRGKFDVHRWLKVYNYT